ncbi:MAG: hypothetical protein HKN54_10120 [Flavobacteriaceae bacterium]|nr:hypothetical protein [Flavobacteriaceae bacterium]
MHTKEKLRKTLLWLLIVVFTGIVVFLFYRGYFALEESENLLEVEEATNEVNSVLNEIQLSETVKAMKVNPNSTQDLDIKNLDSSKIELTLQESISQESEELPILFPNEINSFILLQAMKDPGYLPNKDNWSLDSENFINNILVDNPLSPETKTRFLCDQQTCFIESVVDNVDFVNAQLGESAEWDKFVNTIKNHEEFGEFFHPIISTTLIAPDIERNQQYRQQLFVRK